VLAGIYLQKIKQNAILNMVDALDDRIFHNLFHDRLDFEELMILAHAPQSKSSPMGGGQLTLFLCLLE
jgi:hypothetical protein